MIARLQAFRRMRRFPFDCRRAHRRAAGTVQLRSHSTTAPETANGKDTRRYHPNPRVDALVAQYLSFLPEKVEGSIARQLYGPHQELPPLSKHAVFVNNSMDLGSIDVLGLDFDYTVCDYTSELEELIYQQAKEYLVENCGYPTEIRQSRYDPNFGIRGLAVDTNKGLILKLSYIHQISPRYVYRGRRALSELEVMEEYGTLHVSPQYRNQHMKPLVDTFSLSLACLLADVMEFLITNKFHHDTRAVVEDVFKAIRVVHTSGIMHESVLKNPVKYLAPSPHLRITLQRFRDAGKKIFLCSNSGFEYVNGGLRYMLGTDWKDFFDVVIVGARKPHFYTSDQPFRHISQETGKILWTQVRRLAKGKVYTHGSLQALSDMTGWKGPRVLYMGDNLWADLVDARRLQGWRTGAVIRELENELEVQNSQAYMDRVNHIMAVTTLLRLTQEEMEKSRQGQGTYYISEGENQSPLLHHYRFRQYPHYEEDVRTLDLLHKHLQKLNVEMSSMFNPNFGSVFRSEGEPTLFAFSLRRYVDIYMAKIENLRFYSPEHRFYPERGVSMPHDPKIISYVARKMHSNHSI